MRLCLQHADAAAGALRRSLDYLVICDIDSGPPVTVQEAYEKPAMVGRLFRYYSICEQPSEMLAWSSFTP